MTRLASLALPTGQGSWTSWTSDNETLLWWLGGTSLFLLIASAVALPFILARIPADHYVPDDRPLVRPETRFSTLRLIRRIGKNILGAILLLAGLAMLVLPGQGLLAILVGLMLIDFPGRYRLTKKLLRRPHVSKAVNWVRRKTGAPPLLFSREEAAAAGYPIDEQARARDRAATGERSGVRSGSEHGDGDGDSHGDGDGDGDHRHERARSKGAGERTDAPGDAAAKER
jgi:hypothetical protein